MKTESPKDPQTQEVNSKGIYPFQKQIEGEHLTLPAGQPTHRTSPHPIQLNLETGTLPLEMELWLKGQQDIRKILLV